VIGEPAQVHLPVSNTQRSRPALRIDDLQDEGSPALVHFPPPSQPRSDFARTNSISPPLHEKLALENKLASIELVHQMGTLKTPSEPWNLQVTIAGAKMVPWKIGVQECCCCLSLLQATANISSRSFHSISHVQAGQNSSPLTVVDGSLEIIAMDRTSVVRVEETTKWNETIILTEMHPSAVQIATSSCSSTDTLAHREQGSESEWKLIPMHLCWEMLVPMLSALLESASHNSFGV
jgi:hypothetical protein